MPRRHLFAASLESGSYYHCVSRATNREFVFDVHEKDVFRKILRQVEAFSGVRVLTWTILSNHFHVLLHVPRRPAAGLTDEEILERCRALYTSEAMVTIELEFQDAQRIGGDTLDQLRTRWLRRMWDLSEFMKTLKQKFTFWYNREHGRVGTLWESRFKSVIVEGHWNSLLKVAAYVDLNAVRAGLVSDPKDYRWCGYCEAVAGNRAARRGLSAALADLKENANWDDVGPHYRKILFGMGEGSTVRTGLSKAAVAKVWAAGGKLSLAQLLRCRVRYFSDGMAVGRESFIESVFAVLRDSFSAKRECGPRRMHGGAGWDGLRSARALKVEPVAPGG